MQYYFAIGVSGSSLQPTKLLNLDSSSVVSISHSRGGDIEPTENRRWIIVDKATFFSRMARPVILTSWIYSCK